MTRFARAPRATRRAMAAALLGALFGAALVATAAAPASAHTPAVSATCSTLSVSLQYYARSDAHPRPNTVSVSVDGVGVASEWFGASFAEDFALGDPAQSHTWRVVVDAVDNYDRTFEGTTTPCAPPTPQDASAALQTTPPTCAAGETLVLGTAVHATWSTPTTTTGPGDYAVTATAATGHLFDDGTATRSFTGTLAGPISSDAPECAPEVDPTPPTPPTVTPEKPEPVSTSSRTLTVDCEIDMVTITTTTVVTDWVLNGDGTEWVLAEPVTTTASTTERVTPGDCPDESDGDGGGTGGDGEGPGGDGEGPGDGVGADGEEGIVGSVFEIGPEFGVGSLAHSGPESAAAFFLSISLLAAGGIVLLRHRAASLAIQADEQ